MTYLLAILAVLAMAMTTETAIAAPLRVALTVREWAGAPRADEPVASGIPFRPGVLRDISKLRHTGVFVSGIGLKSIFHRLSLPMILSSKSSVSFCKDCISSWISSRVRKG